MSVDYLLPMWVDRTVYSLLESLFQLHGLKELGFSEPDIDALIAKNHSLRETLKLELAQTA